MIITGGWLYLTLILLGVWFAVLCQTCWLCLQIPSSGLKRTIRNQVTIAGIGFSTAAVGSLLALHLTWISPAVSQHLGVTAIRIFALLLFWSMLAGLLLSVAGSGRTRFLGIGTSLITGLWWFALLMTAAISMSAPTTRHPTRFLIPDGYLGWVEVKYGELGTPGFPMDNGTLVSRIPGDGLLVTSSLLETGWAKDEYFYYSEDGSIRALKDSGWGGGGMIWGGSTEWQQSPNVSRAARIAQYFYVGTEEQYRREVSANEGRPFNEAKRDKPTP